MLILRRNRFRILFFFTLSLLLCDIAKAQLSTIHYLPPLYGRDESIIQKHFILVTNPNQSRIANVLILDGSGQVLFNEAVGNGTTFKADLGVGLDANGVIGTDQLNTVISQDENLLVQSDIPVYVQIRHTISDPNNTEIDRHLHGLISSSKGDWAIGTRFRTGFGYSSNSGVNNEITPDGRSDFISFMATEDNTIVTISDIHPQVNFEGVWGTPNNIKVTLNGGESYTVAHFPDSDLSNLKLNGTLLTSDRPIVVNCGSWALDNSPEDRSQREIAAEQIIPMSRLHTEYVVMNVDGVELAEKVLIVGDQDGTIYYINGSPSPSGTVDAGEFVVINKNRFSTQGNMYIETSVPTPIYQTTGLQHYSVGYTIITPLKCWGTQSTVIPRIDGDFALEDSRINIVAPNGTAINVLGGTLGVAEPIPGLGGYKTRRVTPSITDDIFITSNKNIQVMTSYRSIARGAATYYAEYFQTDTMIVANDCPGAVYEVGASVYTETGVYYDTLVNINGCDSLVMLDLTIHEDDESIQEEDICEGDSFYFHGNYYTESTQVFQTVPSSFGCDSTIMLDLTVLPNAFETVYFDVCPGDLVAGVELENDTSIFVVGTSSLLCDSTTTYEFTVLEEFETNLTFETCPEELVIHNGIPYPVPGTYYETIPASNGCDSTLIIDVIHYEVPPQFETVSICIGETYDGIAINQDTIIEEYIFSLDGCIQQLIVEVVLLPDSYVAQEFISCPGQDYNGIVYYSDTTFVENLLNVYGCDSTVTTSIQLETFTSLDTVYLNSGDIFNGVVYTVDDLLEQDLQNIDGCDSLAITQIIINPVLTGVIVVDLCPGETFDLYTPSQDTTYQTEHTASNGFDSITIFNLYVHPTFSMTNTMHVCEGDSILIYDNYEFEAGTYTFEGTTIWGCDSVFTTELIIDPLAEFSRTEIICEGESIFLAGAMQTEEGSYQEQYTTLQGCDSLVTIALEVLPNSEEVLDLEFCLFENYDGVFLTQDTTLVNFYNSANGCDSIVYTNITIELPTTSIDTMYVFENEGYEGDTLLVDNLQSELGCDSTVILQIILLPPSENTLFEILCEGELFNNFIINQDTFFVDIYTAANGADSTVTTIVNVLYDTESENTVTICEGDIYNGVVYFENGILYDYTLNTNGCDSTIVTNIEVIPPVEDETTIYLIEGETYLGQLFQGDTLLVDNFSSQIGCDSTFYTNIIILPHIYTQDTVQVCESSFYEGYIINQDTTFIEALISWTGSDSIHTTFVETLPFTYDLLTESICPGESIFLAGDFQTVAGDYVDTIYSSVDCPLILTTSLIILETTTESFFYDACDGAVISFNGAEITTNQIVILDVPNQEGCLNSEIHNFVFYDNQETFIEGQICLGTSYNFNGIILEEAGVYYDTLNTFQSCDSIVQLTLTVGDIFEVELPLADSYCEGENTILFAGDYASYAWPDGSTNSTILVEESGTFEVTVTDFNGCEGLVFIAAPPPNLTELNVEILQPDCLEQEFGSLEILQPLSGNNFTYSINGSDLNSDIQVDQLPAGTYEVVATDDIGCSISQTFNIEIFREPAVDIRAETEMTLGDSTLLNTITNAFPIEQILWSPSTYLSCDTCLNPWASPPNDFTYMVTIYTSEGCIISDVISLKVEKNYSIYIPNGFSPNGDGINDQFTVYTGGAVDKVQSLQVYDRWGNKVFINENFEPNIEAEGWNGTYRNEPMNPGVFVYQAEILLLTGEVVFEKGDVTLIY